MQRLLIALLLPGRCKIELFLALQQGGVHRLLHEAAVWVGGARRGGASLGRV